jgi:hypothetical protein
MVELSTEAANPPTTEALQEELDALRQEATIHALSVAKPPAPRPSKGLLMHTGIRLTITLGDDPVYIADSDDMYISAFMQTGQLNKDMDLLRDDALGMAFLPLEQTGVRILIRAVSLPDIPDDDDDDEDEA